MTVERETFQSSRIGFDQLYIALQKKYEEERLSKQVNPAKMFGLVCA